MNNKKIPTWLGTTVIIIIAITVGMFVWKIEKNKIIKSSSQISVKNIDLEKENSVKTSDKWTSVSHENFWNNPNLFANRDYKFPNIEFSYPSDWKFQCCNDTNNGSTHIIYSSKDRDKSLPYIRITDYVLSGCPSLKNDCSIDKIVKLTANEKFSRLISAVSSDNILPKLELKNINTSAFVFNKTEKDDITSRAYIINLGNDVIQVDFIDYKSLDDKFIENFLNRIYFENK